MPIIKSIAPGILLTILISTIAWELGGRYPIIGAPVFSILMGMLINYFIQPKMKLLKHGIQFSSKKLLQLSIILMGFQMNLIRVLEVGKQSLSIMIFTLSASFITALIFSKILKTDRDTTILIGVGTSICGGSAIAATAPVIDASDEDVAHSISTIFLFNIMAVFIFPALGQLLSMTDYGFGVFAGTAINDTSSVVASATAWSNISGNNIALTTATVVKLTRTLMIIPITMFLSIKFSKNKNQQAFNPLTIFPWFILGFLFTSLLSTFFSLPSELIKFLILCGKFMIVTAMSAIGLNTNLIKLIKNGFRPLLLGAMCWLAVSLTSIIVQHFSNLF